jgi:hypothetical protein
MFIHAIADWYGFSLLINEWDPIHCQTGITELRLYKGSAEPWRAERFTFHPEFNGARKLEWRRIKNGKTFDGWSITGPLIRLRAEA